MKLSFIGLCVVFTLYGCKEEEIPQFSGKWETRGLSTSGRADNPWYIGRPDSTMYDIAPDSTVVHSGKWSAHIFSVSDSPTYVGYIAASLDADLVKAKRVSVTGWSKSENTAGTAFMFVRMRREPTGEQKELTIGKKIYDEIASFAGMEELPEWMLLNDERPLSGTSDWQKHEFVFDVPLEALHIWFGAILSGQGKIWIDDFSYKIVDRLPVDKSFKDRSTYIAKPKSLDFEFSE